VRKGEVEGGKISGLEDIRGKESTRNEEKEDQVDKAANSKSGVTLGEG